MYPLDGTIVSSSSVITVSIGICVVIRVSKTVLSVVSTGNIVEASISVINNSVVVVVDTVVSVVDSETKNQNFNSYSKNILLISSQAFLLPFL